MAAISHISRELSVKIKTKIGHRAVIKHPYIKIWSTNFVQTWLKCEDNDKNVNKKYYCSDIIIAKIRNEPLTALSFNQIHLTLRRCFWHSKFRPLFNFYLKKQGPWFLSAFWLTMGRIITEKKSHKISCVF